MHTPTNVKKLRTNKKKILDNYEEEIHNYQMLIGYEWNKNEDCNHRHHQQSRFLAFLENKLIAQSKESRFISL